MMDASREALKKRQKPFSRFLSNREGNVTPYLLLLPSLLLIAFIIVYPFLTGILYSLREGSLLKLGPFVGLDNFVQLFGEPDFRHAALFSLYFAVFNVIGSYVLGLGLAILLNQDIPLRGFLRVSFLLPWILPSIVAVTSWRWMIKDQYGLINVLLGQFGVEPIYFLSTETWAVVATIVVKIWRSYPFVLLSLLAALQGIDQTLYEAARIDGAGSWQTFRHITLPQLKNISIVVCILMTIWSVNGFDSIWLLTQGGPSKATENFIVLAFRYTFSSNNVGLGSAVAVVSFLILTVFAALMLRAQRETD